ncbi:MAG: glycerol acyltransferase, partial [bacterium]
MSALCIAIYRFFHRNPWIFRCFLAAMIACILFFGSRIRLEEDISRITGEKDSLSKDEYVIRNFKFAEKLVVHIRQTDSTQAPQPDSLIRVANTICDSLSARLDSAYIREIFLRTSDAQAETILDLIDNHLPVFLEEEDYLILDSLDDPAKIQSIVRNNYKAIFSLAGMALKKRVAQDPLGISNLVLKKLSTLQVDNRYRLFDGYILSDDLRHLLIFITPANPPSETSKNGLLISTLNKVISTSTSGFPPPTKGESQTIKADYFGSVAVAVGNANQLKRDILLSLSLAILAILLLLGWYFRNAAIPFLGFLPAFFGGGLALTILFLVKGSVSVIALGIGSVILGLIIDYALYMINHFRKQRNVEQVLRDMAQTILVCSLTSIGAFLC